MFKQIFLLQWRSSRLVLLPLVLMAFALPVLTVQGLGAPGGFGMSRYPVAWLLDSMRIWLPVYPALATVVGVSVALASWSWDHKEGHVYALSLPIARWKYALLKMGAGTLLLLGPVAALWAGGVAATASVVMPEGLHAYPTDLAVRFLVLALLAFSLFFAFAAGTVRTTVTVLTGLVVFFVVGQWGVELAGQFFPTMEHWNLVEWTLQRLVDWPGPAEVLTGNWMLIDV